MARVFWPQATLDRLDDIVAYISIYNPTAAKQIGDKLFALGESLSEFPNRGRPGRNGTRELPSVQPYVLIYDVNENDEQVTILHIRHGRQRPLA